MAYCWPGNVRELENCIERAVVMSSDNEVSLEILPEEIRECRPDPAILPNPGSSADPQSELRQAVIRLLISNADPSGMRDLILGTVEETLLRHLVDSGRYSQRELARLLCLSRVTLRKKLDHYKLS
jgi:two-component system response regulator HydG